MSIRFTDRRLTLQNSKTILVVDDEAPIRLLVSCILNQAGYEVILACDGLEAMMRIDRGCEFDLLLTDLAMPGMNGIKLGAYARKALPGIPIVYVSGVRDSFPEALTGPNVIAKPFTPAELLDAIDEALAKGGPNTRVSRPRAAVSI